MVVQILGCPGRCLASRAFDRVYCHGSLVLVTGRSFDWPHFGTLPKGKPRCIV